MSGPARVEIGGVLGDAREAQRRAGVVPGQREEAQKKQKVRVLDLVEAGLDCLRGVHAVGDVAADPHPARVAGRGELRDPRGRHGAVDLDLGVAGVVIARDGRERLVEGAGDDAGRRGGTDRAIDQAGAQDGAGRSRVPAS